MIVIDEDGREVPVLFTNRALYEAEQGMGKSIVEALRDMTANRLGITDTVHILEAGMEAARRDGKIGGRPVSMTAAFQVLDQAGLVPVVTVIAEAASAVISYGTEEDAEGDDDPNV